MGRRGPIPTPTARLEARGSRHTYTRRGEPRPPVVAPLRPSWLDPMAAAAWDEVVRYLVGAGVAAELDGLALAVWCETWARWRRCGDLLARLGPTMETRAGPRVRPEARLEVRLAGELRQWGARFGLGRSMPVQLARAIEASWRSGQAAGAPGGRP